MREIYIKSKAGLLPIGRRGENLATRVHLAEAPAEGQAVTVYVLRNGDSASYPASQVEITDTEIVWTVTSVDTGKSGRGKVQYKFADATTGEVIKTEIYGFIVGLAIDTEVGPAPDPYETWLDSLTDLAGQAQVAARDAEASATAADESAGSASESAQNAEQSASSAGTHATNAQTSATTAAQKAAQAAASEASAQTYATQAQASRERAITAQTEAESAARQASASAASADESKTAAETARQRAYQWAQYSETYSDSASASAGRASASEVNAGQSATAASASATSASQSATTATSKAAEASASATTATTKAAEASASATAAQAAQTGAETAQAASESAAQTAQAGADAVGLLREQIYNSYPNVEAEAGPIVSIPDGADGIPVKSLVVGIEPVQAGSGDPSPDNVRPITGWTGAEIVRTGKNLLDVDWYGDTLPRTSNGITWSKVRDGVYHAQGTATASSYFNVSFSGDVKKAMPCVPFVGKRLFLSVTGSQINVAIGYFREDGTFSQAPNGSIIPDDAVGLRAYVRVAQNTVIDADFSIQLEIGSTATAYEPYQGETYQITFHSEAGTVYGGSLDVTTGVLTVDKAINVIDGTQALSSNGTQPYGGIQVRYTPSPAKKLADTSATQNSGLLSDKFDTSSPYTDAEYQLSGRATNANVYINMSASITTAAQARAWFAENNTQVVYELAEPITYQLTPAEVITTLLGSNAFWADTGDVQEMAYRADPKLYIDGVYEEYQDDLADYADALAALG